MFTTRDSCQSFYRHTPNCASLHPRAGLLGKENLPGSGVHLTCADTFTRRKKTCRAFEKLHDNLEEEKKKKVKPEYTLVLLSQDGEK